MDSGAVAADDPDAAAVVGVDVSTAGSSVIARADVSAEHPFIMMRMMMMVPMANHKGNIKDLREVSSFSIADKC